MLAGAPLVAFVPSSDLARSRRFYEDLLGLAVVEETPIALVLDAEGTQLRVTLVGDFTPFPFTVVGWEVDEIRARLADLGARGVEPVRYDSLEQDDAGVWTAPAGALIAWFRDPDGNTLSLAQPAGG
jgi:catechol 2,3-dioxygenase-like lactoylglutathione lyase family enzyme